MNRHREIYVDGDRYVSYDIYEKIQYLKQRAKDVTQNSDKEVALEILTALIDMLPWEPED